LWLKALAVEGRWGLPIADRIMLMRLKREAADREAAELKDLHEAEIAAITF
jgi:hypothetical protein